MASSYNNHLPTEIWYQIILEVTYYPGEFDAVEWVGSNGNGNCSELELARRDITSNMPTNRFILHHRRQQDDESNFRFQLFMRSSLVLVCRQWYNLAIRRLYGSIIVQNAGIRTVASAFTSNANLGPFVKRLELHCWDHLKYTMDILLILSKCSNLIIFYESSKSLRMAIAWWHLLHDSRRAICANLLFAAGDPAKLSKLSFATTISSFSSLIALKLPQLTGIGDDSSQSYPITLPNLRVLDFGLVINVQDPLVNSFICDWALPALQAVWIRVEGQTVIPLTKFWMKHGRKLTTIKIYDYPSYTPAEDGWINVSLGIESIDRPPSEIFPRLRQLIVLHNCLGYYPPLFLPSTSLEIYEVPFHGRMWSFWRCRHLFRQIGEYHIDQLPPNKAPNLRIFRISNFPRKDDVGLRKQIYDEFVRLYLEGMKLKLEERGVTLELLESE